MCDLQFDLVKLGFPVIVPSHWFGEGVVVMELDLMKGRGIRGNHCKGRIQHQLPCLL